MPQAFKPSLILLTSLLDIMPVYPQMVLSLSLTALEILSLENNLRAETNLGTLA